MSSTDASSTTTNASLNTNPRWSIRSRLYTGPNLPTYHTFLHKLQLLDPDTLPPNTDCPICRIPFSESRSVFGDGGPAALDHQRFLALEALPFHNIDGTNHARFDRPIRLPCTSGHIVGSTCIRSWAREGGGTTCPLDREELFTIDLEERFTVRHDEDRFNSGVRDVQRMPIRHLLRRFRNATEQDIVTVNARSMTTRLATLIFRVVFHVHGISEDVTSRWKWPRIRQPLYGYREATHFHSLVKKFIENELLTETGQYDDHIVALLNPALPHVFALLYRLAKFYQTKSEPVHALAYYMRDRLHAFFLDFAYIITDERTLEAIAFMAIDLWVTQELLMTELRAATNQQNEWEHDMWLVGSDHEHPRRMQPYFSIGGAGGMLGYLHEPRYGRDRSAWRIPLMLSEAAEVVRFDEESERPLYTTRGSGNRARISPSSSGPYIPARSWSPLSDNETHSQRRNGGFIARVARRMNRRVGAHLRRQYSHSEYSLSE